MLKSKQLLPERDSSINIKIEGERVEKEVKTAEGRSRYMKN